ncbi:BppU family phage baseplate upper protein [Bacillus paranthracis]|uniref:SGNH/GDSL hydrolase family protein n=1 Tax=Bacillus paranthracis TaxID=2026186 RepID=UPI00254F4FD0|nr:SGNH/GDSL hydrolase family protein [Bacillus paranthracis]MDK7537802.1 BppU family phage baseplate upper protein [Bacillus paranthracis]MDK7560992.1 BppU family phage baseplate upper protein [Bacillus paranthracis]
MTFKTRELTVDLVNEIPAKEIRFSQGDRNSAKLVLNITNEGQELDLSQAKAVRITFEKQDGKIVFQQDCQPINAMKGKYQIVLKTQTLAVIGNVLGQITIFEDDDREIDSQMFVFTVKRSLSGNEAVESTNEFTIIQKAIEAGEKLEGKDIDGIIAAGAKADAALVEVNKNKDQIGILSSNVSDVETKLADKTDKTYVDTKISAVASGSPKGAFATLSNLQAAFPTGSTGTYVVQDDGKLYAWLNAAWTAIVQYQSSGIADKSINPLKMDNYIPAKNFFNKDSATLGKFISGNGTIGDNATYSLSDFIPVEPNTDIVANELEYSSYFDKNKVFVSGNGFGKLKTQKVPANAYFIRVSVPNNIIDTYQIEKGTSPTPYTPYQYELKYLTVKNLKLPTSQRDRLYSFKDAWIAWENGQKFPVGFLGDSTVDGANTTGYVDANRHEAQDNAAGGFGKVDYVNTKAYPYLLEQLIKKETGKSSPRIYNIGYSGTYFDWAKPKLDQIFGGVYADVKMVGIVYGINDRTRVATTADYESMMRTNLEYFVNYFYNKGIQPFIVTSQATVEPYDQFGGTYPLRTARDINTVANRVKREVAIKYNLEIIEMTDFGEHAFLYSNYNLTQLISDTLHFGDKGHELEAGFLFSKFCPRVVTTKDNEILGFSSQKVKSLVPAGKPSFLNTFEDGFKVKANYAKADSNDIVMLDFWLLNYSKKQLNLKSFLTTVGSQYVMLNDTKIPLTTNGQSLGNLDIGLHRIQAFTGETTNVDFKGFMLS